MKIAVVSPENDLDVYVNLDVKTDGIRAYISDMDASEEYGYDLDVEEWLIDHVLFLEDADPDIRTRVAALLRKIADNVEAAR